MSGGHKIVQRVSQSLRVRVGAWSRCALKSRIYFGRRCQETEFLKNFQAIGAEKLLVKGYVWIWVFEIESAKA